VSGSGLEQQLAAWERAGILTPEQCERIRLFEAAPRETSASGTSSTSRSSERSNPGRDERRDDRRGRISEIVGYVGAAFAVGAVGLLFQQIWDRFEPWAQVTLVLLLATTAIAAGAALVRRPGLPLRRLTAILWLSGVAAGSWAAALVGTNLLGLREERLALLVGLTIVAGGAVLLRIGGHAVLQLASAVGLIVTVVSAVSLLSPLPPAPTTYGVLLIGGGIAWALAGGGGWLGPVRTAEVAGSVLALIGSQVFAAGDGRLAGLFVGLVIAAIVVASSLVGDRPHLLLVGAAGLFVIVPRLVFELFADTIGAPATLLTVGILLILLATGLGRVRSSRGRGEVSTSAGPVGRVAILGEGDTNG
jgi:hypothetical protein